MISKKQAYELVLDSLINCSQAVENASKQWKMTPKLQLRVVSHSIVSTINKALKGIKKIISELSKEDIQTASTLDHIHERLSTFKNFLIQPEQTSTIASGAELLRAWQIVLKNILEDITRQTPDIMSSKLYKTIEKRAS
ncbi:hypothetical protein D6825_01540 [Candidatus Woesearchaeota archaeon]|nr:MAG: hypothetical protein D6825_01540 [Candidatus Woesearchaeota archaeon]